MGITTMEGEEGVSSRAMAEVEEGMGAVVEEVVMEEDVEADSGKRWEGIIGMRDRYEGESVTMLHVQLHFE